MKLSDRAEALVALVESDSAARRKAVLDPAAAQARELLRHARRNARMRVATAIGEERAAYTSRVEGAQARLDTARRMAEQRRMRALAADGWERLAPAMAARWKDEAGRHAWVGAALEHALALLSAPRWSIRSNGDWSAEERARTASELSARGIAIAFEDDASIAAGLVITGGKVEVDASLAGLLADRLAVQGRLLANTGAWYGTGTGARCGTGAGQVCGNPGE